MIIPPKILSANLTEINAVDFWTIDDGTGDPWIGSPYRWNVVIQVSSQSHSYLNSRTPFFYDGNDVSVGDWIGEIASGVAVKIISIDSQNGSEVFCTVEDVDRLNTFTDPTQSGNGMGNVGPYVIFSIGDDGIPVLGPFSGSNTLLSGNLAFQMDLISRFRFRNYLRSHYPVHQPAHEFTNGELLVLGVDGYEKAEADDYVDSIVGSVSSVGIPGPEWFTYRPVGRVVDNIEPNLPGNPGDLIYISATGTLTLIKPTAWARPVYIRLETGNKGIVLDRGVDAVSKNGYSSQTYVVPNINERDDLEGINLGDQCLIKNAGNGEWNHYIYEANDTWTLLGTQDSANVDSATKTVSITHLSDPSAIIATISTGRRVDEVIVQVKEAFDGTASLQIGTDANHAFLMDAAQNDLNAVDAYHTTPSCVLQNGGMDTRVKYWLSTSGCTKGKAVISITYS